MDVPRAAAVEIDRLVLAVNRAVGPRHGERLGAMAAEIGLDSLSLLPHFEDFLLGGTLTRDLAVTRMRYWPAETVLGRLDELEAKGLVQTTHTGIAAAPRLQPLLEALLAARADVAALTWSGHERDVATVTAAARRVAAAATPAHAVAVAHRDLPEPDDPHLRLEHLLFTLRYIRQHDHAAAWLDRGLTAPQIVVMTRLWTGEDVDAGDAALADLVAAGHAAPDPPRLTAAGLELREAIEADTNERAQQSFDVLDDAAAREFLAALRRLPGA